VSRLPLAPGGTVLDLCCGTGASALPAARAVGSSGHVLAIDLAAPMLEVARTRAAAEGLAQLEFRLGDATRTGLPDGGFDAVVCVSGVFFAPDMAAFMREMWRLVRPGGVLAVTTWGLGCGSPAAAISGAASARSSRPCSGRTTRGTRSPPRAPWPGCSPRPECRTRSWSRWQASITWTTRTGSGTSCSGPATGPRCAHSAQSSATRVRADLLADLRSHEIMTLRTDVVSGTAERPE
jgi:SAM-dependent methyltransferase